MQSLKALCSDMLADQAFRELFEKECHICTTTMRIFASLDRAGSTPAQLAHSLGVATTAVDDLAAAECCDPHLVVRIYRHLDLPVPESCPRMTAKQG